MGLLGETKPVKKPILGVSLYPEQESIEEIENYDYTVGYPVKLSFPG